MISWSPYRISDPRRLTVPAFGARLHSTSTSPPTRVAEGHSRVRWCRRTSTTRASRLQGRRRPPTADMTRKTRHWIRGDRMTSVATKVIYLWQLFQAPQPVGSCTPSLLHPWGAALVSRLAMRHTDGGARALSGAADSARNLGPGEGSTNTARMLSQHG